MNSANIKKWILLLEKEMPHSGTRDSKNIQYTITGDKVIARLKNVDSTRYTRLGRNLKRMEWLAARMDYLKEQTKQDTRELIADLFLAEDANKTRVVETMGFIFKLTKDPKAAETVKYTKVLDELQDKLTPELIRVLEALVAKHTTLQKPKPAALTAIDRNQVKTESVMDWASGIKSFLKKLKTTLDRWGQGYDNRLDQLKSEIGF